MMGEAKFPGRRAVVMVISNSTKPDMGITTINGFTAVDFTPFVLH